MDRYEGPAWFSLPAKSKICAGPQDQALPHAAFPVIHDT